MGEDGFIEIENRVNADVDAENAVISPGGSVIYCEEAMKHYKNIGTVVYFESVLSDNKKENPQSEKARSCSARRTDVSAAFMKSA